MLIGMESLRWLNLGTNLFDLEISWIWNFEFLQFKEAMLI